MEDIVIGIVANYVFGFVATMRFVALPVAVALLLTALACFVVLDSSVKHISAVISVLIAVWFRYMFQAVVMSDVLLPLRGRQLLHTRHLPLQIVRGLLLLVVSVLGY